MSAIQSGNGALPEVVALMAVHNEADLLGAVLSHLSGQGIGIYVLENWSTDGSAEIARGFIGKGVVGIEQFPEKRDEGYNLRTILERKAQLAWEMGRSGARWVVHHDADEIRESPWPGVNLREGLGRVAAEGYDAVDEVVLVFRPTDEGFAPGMSPADYFRQFTWDRARAPLTHVKSWLQNGQKADLALFGGHSAEFEGRRVYPLPFINRHYPVRSSAQGRRKLAERQARCAAESIERGWHVHYQGAEEAVIYPPDHPDLIVYEELAVKRMIAEHATHPEPAMLQAQMANLRWELANARDAIRRLQQREPPLRHRVADRLNDGLKRIGVLHDVAKRMLNRREDQPENQRPS